MQWSLGYGGWAHAQCRRTLLELLVRVKHVFQNPRYPGLLASAASQPLLPQRVWMLTARARVVHPSFVVPGGQWLLNACAEERWAVGGWAIVPVLYEMSIAVNPPSSGLSMTQSSHTSQSGSARRARSGLSRRRGVRGDVNGGRTSSTWVGTWTARQTASARRTSSTLSGKRFAPNPVKELWLSLLAHDCDVAVDYSSVEPCRSSLGHAARAGGVAFASVKDWTVVLSLGRVREQLAAQ